MNKPSEYVFDDISKGQKKEFNLVVSESLVADFAKLSGDYNPLHMDDDYSKSTKFKQRICHGLLLTSFLSRLIGMYIPGKNALYVSQTVKFMFPCFIDDQIFVKGEVTDKSPSTKIITVKTSITNSSGNRLIDGEAKVLVR
jgi:3-hydroxybutyryl-CoA dehydratase